MYRCIGEASMDSEFQVHVSPPNKNCPQGKNATTRIGEKCFHQDSNIQISRLFQTHLNQFLTKVGVVPNQTADLEFKAHSTLKIPRTKTMPRSISIVWNAPNLSSCQRSQGNLLNPIQNKNVSVLLALQLSSCYCMVSGTSADDLEVLIEKKEANSRYCSPYCFTVAGSFQSYYGM